MKYAAINTMDKLDTAGKVMSLHRTIEAALAAESRVQRAIKDLYGPGSYLPTRVCEVSASVRKGQYISANDILSHAE
jgi:hypothetical protein